MPRQIAVPARLGSWFSIIKLRHTAALVLLLTGAAFAQTSFTNRGFSQTPAQVLDGRATLTQHYDPAKKLRLTIALTPPHLDQERQLVDELHDKKSPEFHHFLTAEQWNARFSPSSEDEQAVVNWAQSQGFTVTNRYANRLLVDVEAPAGTIEKALNVKINNYQMGSKTYYANDRDPEIPSGLTNTVQAILGLHSFLELRPSHTGVPSTLSRPDYVPGPAETTVPAQQAAGDRQKLAAAMNQSKIRASMRSQAAKTGGPQETYGYYDPTDIYSSEAYDWDALDALQHCCNPLNNPAGSPPPTSIAIAGYGDVNYSDLLGFHAQYPYLAYNVQKIPIDGGYTCHDQPNKPDDNCLEITLDTEYSLAMANSFGSPLATAKIWVYEGAHFGEVADMYNHMQEDGLARVTSTSWGCEEFACFDAPTMKALDGIFTSMVGQGWTLIAASGDEGATAGCGDKLAIEYPASDPNMVAAGGTRLLFNPDDNSDVYQSETGWEGAPWAGSCAQNFGGGTGGFSTAFGAPSYQAGLGFTQRAVPDMALNAEAPMNMYYAANGGLFAVGGTSVVAPELAGFFAQANAYALSLGDVCGASGTAACAPIGNPDYYLYAAGLDQTAPHYPFYDILSGCNDNDVTTLYNLTPYCAGPGFDEVTGWGSANMLQLAWAINWFDAAANGAPSIAFTGPATDGWYNTDQIIDWNVTDNAGTSSSSGTGIAGYTQGWDSILNDSHSEATPGTGDSFYAGPQHTNETFGCSELDGGICSGGPSGQGCHTLYVEAWNNMGVPSGVQAYGPICYDSVAPATKYSLSGTKYGSSFVSSATVSLSATDSTSGVKAIYFRLDGGASTAYAGAFSVMFPGTHNVAFYAVDWAGNQSAVSDATFTIVSPTSTSLIANVSSASYGTSVSLYASVSSKSGGLPGGTVTFKKGTTTLGTATISNGLATLSSTALNVGSNSVTAAYNGSSDDEASTSAPIIETITKASTSTVVASSANPSSWDESVTFTVTVKSGTTGIPTGTVTLMDGTTSLGTATLNNGKAEFAIASLGLGAHSISAVYNGSTDYHSSTSSVLTQTVDKAATTTTIVSNLNPSTSGNAVTFTATVSSNAGVPTGTISFMDGTKQIGTGTLAGGKATFTTSALATGTHSIQAEYSGTTDLATSKSAILSQKVNP